MKPGWGQQAVAGVAVLLVIAATIAGGILLALSDNPAAFQASISPTATTIRLSTITPALTMGTPIPTGEPSATPSPAQTQAPSPTLPPPTRTPAPTRPPQTTCQIASGWVTYRVQPGDTLFRIGLAYGLTVDRLLAGNCRSSQSLAAGETLYVPPVTPLATQAVAASPTGTQAGTPATGTPQTPAGPTVTQYPTQSPSDGQCWDPQSAITSPPVGATLRGQQSFYGTAVRSDFQYYKLEIRREGSSTPADFITFETRYEQVTNGLLGSLDTTAFEDGEYWIRLVVVESTGNYLERCSILYTIDN